MVSYCQKEEGSGQRAEPLQKEGSRNHGFVTIATRLATIHNYKDSSLAKPENQSQHEQYNHAVATPSIPPNPECSASDTITIQEYFISSLTALGIHFGVRGAKLSRRTPTANFVSESPSAARGPCIVAGPEAHGSHGADPTIAFVDGRQRKTPSPSRCGS